MVVVWSAGNVQHLNQGEPAASIFELKYSSLGSLFTIQHRTSLAALENHTMYIKVVHKRVPYNVACNFVEFTSIISG